MLLKDPLTGVTRIDKSPTQICYYDTGKVKIGCAYVPKPMPMHPDAVQIQGILLSHRPLTLATFAVLAYLVVMALLLTLIFLTSI
jgi:hypothetical protein